MYKRRIDEGVGRLSNVMYQSLYFAYYSGSIQFQD